MAVPGLDRILSGGWYGTITTRSISVFTNGWYDDVGVVLEAPFTIAFTVKKPGINFAVERPVKDFSVEKPAINLVTK